MSTKYLQLAPVDEISTAHPPVDQTYMYVNKVYDDFKYVSLIYFKRSS